MVLGGPQIWLGGSQMILFRGAPKIGLVELELAVANLASELDGKTLL